MENAADVCLDDIDYSDLEAQFKVPEDISTECILVIDHLPVFEAAKETLFINKAIKKKVLTVHGPVKEGGIYMPKDPQTGLTKGYMFVEYESPEAMKRTCEVANGFVLDKDHKFTAFPLDDLERLAQLELSELEHKAGEYKEKEYYKKWLEDPLGRDQFLVQYGGYNTVGIYWNEKQGPATEIKTMEKVAEYVQWSSQGTYLAEFHKQGIMLKYGCEEWHLFGRFAHPGVRFISFSTTERFLATWSTDPLSATGNNTVVWEVATGKALFSTYLPAPAPSALNERRVFWPLVKWSFDDAYFALYQDSSLFVYELFKEDQAFDFNFKARLATPKPIPVEDLQEFSWAPAKAHWLAYWSPEVQNTPAKVAIIEMPTQKLIRSKNLFKVTTCSIHWQNEAEYMAVRVDKNKRLINVELFRLNEKDVPVELLECKGTYLGGFEWEPYGSRFVFMDQTRETKPDGKGAMMEIKGPKFLHLYDMASSTKTPGNEISQVRHIKTLQPKNMTRFIWSPRGKFALLAGFGGGSEGPNLEFWMTFADAGIELVASKEHYLMNEAEWDPTGRFVATYVNYNKAQSENYYILWDFKGTLITKCTSLTKMKDFKWRPRPGPSLLSADKVKAIRKDLREYSKQFDAEDALRATENLSTAQKLKLKLKSDWLVWKSHARQQWGLGAEAGKNSPGAADQVVQEWMEEVIEEVEEEIKK